MLNMIKSSFKMILCIVLIIFFVVLFFKKPKLDYYEFNYNDHVILRSNSNLYDANHQIIGSNYEEIILELESVVNKDLFKVKGMDLYVRNNDLKEGSISKTLVMVPFNEEVNINGLDLYKDNNKALKLDIDKSYNIVRKDDEFNYIMLFNKLYGIKKDIKTSYKFNNEVATDIPVLAYHFFYRDKSCKQIICLSESKFHAQLNYLNEANYYTPTLNEFIDWIYKRIELPKKSVLLTVDDGWLGTDLHGENVLISSLEKYKINASIYLISAWYHKDDYKSDYLEVESHTHEMHDFRNCNGRKSMLLCATYDELVTDFKKSIDSLESNKALVYPFYASNSLVRKAVKDVGFQIAFGYGNTNATRNSNVYNIPRKVIISSTTLNGFKNMIR